MNCLGKLEDRNFLCAANVEDFSISFRYRHGAINAFDRVGHIGKAACLKAVAMNRYLAIMQDRVDKDRLGASPPADVMPRTVRPKKPHDCDRDTIGFTVSES